MKLQVEIKGNKSVRDALTRLGVHAPQSMGKALWQEGNRILNQAKDITPVDTGALKGSGIVALPEQEGQQVFVTVGFGGAAAPYAIYVHEDPDARHKPPTQFKFLEQPFMQAQTDMPTRISDALWSDLSHGA